MSDVTEKPLGATPGREAQGDARRRAALMLLVATVIAAVGAALLFAFILYADFLTAAAGAVVEVMFRHSALAVTAATSPLFAAMLVGYGYMQRGMRRRAAEKTRLLAEAAAPSTQSFTPAAGPSK
jgi:hypothetical protein